MSEQPLLIAHVIPQLSLGGAGRALISLAKHSHHSGSYNHSILSLQQPDQQATNLAKSVGAEVLTPQKNRLFATLERADIVQFHFWNTPELHSLLNADLPAMRSLVWLHVNGEHPPHHVTPNICEIADVLIATDTSTLKNSSLGKGRIEFILPSADADRLSTYERVDHSTFNIGYIGTLSFSKMHRDFVAMHAEIDIPSARVMIFGKGPAEAILKRQVKQLGCDNRFEFRGHIENISEALSTIDVFGYPLSSDNYSTGELVLQESMQAGIPAVILPYGGAANRVIHGETGIIAQDRRSYVNAIEFLFRNPDERTRLGANARDYARRQFDAKTMAKEFNGIYGELMRKPKHFPLRRENSTAENTDGALLFLSSLGEIGADFRATLDRQGSQIAVAAEEKIAGLSESLFETLVKYRNYFPNDPSLRFWAGLMLRFLGRPAMAATELNQSIKLGTDHWRVYWHLSHAARESGSVTFAAIAREQAKESARKVGILLE
jgi:glycosyltransferase involved in cell wall biosynthesis